MQAACLWGKLPDLQALKARMIIAAKGSGVNAVCDDAVHIMHRAMTAHICSLLEAASSLRDHTMRGRARAQLAPVQLLLACLPQGCERAALHTALRIQPALLGASRTRVMELLL
jgi:hypothetical protein